MEKCCKVVEKLRKHIGKLLENNGTVVEKAVEKCCKVVEALRKHIGKVMG